MHRLFLLLLALGLAACTAPVAPLDPEIQRAARSFVEVIGRVEPVAESECRRLTVGLNCNFVIEVDTDPREPANAFQTVNDFGQPVIIFTVAMILDARSSDEMAFVLGHETAHHILGHLARQERNAVAGAEILADMAVRAGAGPAEVANARQIGAEIGARVYSKDYELEADRLGTVIALRAGYDPLKGAAYFSRLPDPGDRFLGTHPPNAARIHAVRDTLRRLGAGA